MYHLSDVSLKKGLDPIKIKCKFKVVICLYQHWQGATFNQLGIVEKLHGSSLKTPQLRHVRGNYLPHNTPWLLSNHHHVIKC